VSAIRFRPAFGVQSKCVLPARKSLAGKEGYSYFGRRYYIVRKKQFGTASIFFDRGADNFQETFITPGNHEYYNDTELSDSLTDFEYFLRANVRYLNNKSIVTGKTELFFTTL
jgi:hypothetical protein